MYDSNRKNSNKTQYNNYGGGQGDDPFHYTQYGDNSHQDFKDEFKNKSYGSMDGNYNYGGYTNQGMNYGDVQGSNTDMYGYGDYMNYANPSGSSNSNKTSQGNSYDNLSNSYDYGSNYNNYDSYGSSGYSSTNANYDYYSNKNASDSYSSDYSQSYNNYSASNNGKSQYEYNYNYTSYKADDYSKTVYKGSDYGADDKKVADTSNCEVTVLTPAKSHQVMEAVFRMILYAFIGIICGSLMNSVFGKFWEKHIYNENFFILVINVIGIIVIVVMSYILHIILHEFGHLLGGTLSNYALISFRVFSIVLLKDNKKMKIKKYSVPNTVGECIMMPPEVKKGKYPYKLYRVGGIAMNIVSSIVALILVFGVSSLSKYPWNMCGVIFAVVGCVTAVYNGVPVMIGGVPNDGYLLLHMTETTEASLAVHSQLLIHAFLSKGGTYSDVPYEQFCISKSGEIKNYLVAKVKMLEYRWHLEHLDFTQAVNCLEAMNQYFNSLPKIHQYEVNSEKLFVEIMCENNKDVIDKLYNTDVERFVNEYQNVLTKNRILMAYEAGVNNDYRAAHKHYMQLKNNVKIYPIKGEADLELVLADYVYERFCSGSAGNNR